VEEKMKEIEGNICKEKLLRYKGEAVGHSDSHNGSGKTGIHSGREDLFSHGFRSGRTIVLRRFEFCRIKLSLNVKFENEYDRPIVKRAVKNFILEILKREEFGIEEKEYKPQFEANTIGILNACLDRSIFVSYGLTLKGAKEFESHQVDTMEEIPVSNGDDIVEIFEIISDDIAADISEEHARIKSEVNEKGI
jgi:hypothetical protein